MKYGYGSHQFKNFIPRVTGSVKLRHGSQMLSFREYISFGIKIILQGITKYKLHDINFGLKAIFICKSEKW